MYFLPKQESKIEKCKENINREQKQRNFKEKDKLKENTSAFHIHTDTHIHPSKTQAKMSKSFGW